MNEASATSSRKLPKRMPRSERHDRRSGTRPTRLTHSRMTEAARSIASPSRPCSAWWTVLVPVAGGLIEGLMARFGSEPIRAYGIREAMADSLLSGFPE